MSLGITYPGYRNGFPFQIHHAMEDGTPFAIWDFSGTGDISGRPPAHYVGSGTNFPVGFTLEEMSEIYWRAKTWSIYGEINQSYDFTAVTSTGSGSGSGTFLHEYTIPLAEMKMILAHSFALEATGSATITGGFPIVFSAYVSMFYAAENFGETHFMRFFNGLYWPELEVIMGNIDNVFYLIGGVSSISYETGGGAWESESAVTAEVFGKPVKLYDTAGAYATGNLTVSGSEWWGYGGKFDTTTGERI